VTVDELSRGTTHASAVGSPRRRVEDERLLRGAGRFVDDVRQSGTLQAAFVRSELAHAEIHSIDTAAARDLGGVVAVFTHSEIDAVCGPIISSSPLGDVPPAQFALCRDRVRYVGEPIAIVVAADRYIAEDAADLVVVEYNALDSVTRPAGPGPDLHDGYPGNLLGAVGVVPSEEFAAAVADAAHVFRLEVSSDRVAPSPLEGRAILASVGAEGGTVWVTSQGPHYLQTGLAQTFGLAESRLRVISDDVGGGFGAKLALYQEYVAVVAASMLCGRPVKWTADRREELLTASQAREQSNELTAAVNGDGQVTALAMRARCDAGAYSIWPQTGLLEAFDVIETYPGPYDIPLVCASAEAYFSNKGPAGPYRGISRVHACLGMERLMDEIAALLGLEPLEVRRRNVATDFPRSTAGGLWIESASFAESIARIEELIDVAGFREEQERCRSVGRYPGLGFALAIEPATPGRGIKELGADAMNHYETAAVRVEPDGTVTVHVGTHSHGQGHETTFAQVAADALGVDPDRVHVRFGDTAAMAYGGGTWASRSAVLGSGAILGAAAAIIDKARVVAASILSCDPRDVAFDDGGFHGPDAAVGWAEVGRRANYDAHLLPVSVTPGLEATYRYVGPDGGTVSNRLHAAFVEVDVRTGLVHINRYVAIEDCGNMINPLVVAGQVRGGVAQGIGQALYERLSFDDQGQPLATTMLDYLLPTADSVPPIELVHLASPSPETPYGLKGVGEGGAIPPPAAIANAVTDALRPFGASFNRTPITPDDIIAATRRLDQR
jgi:carbon-monoxide dehydrogenase large subunit